MLTHINNEDDHYKIMFVMKRALDLLRSEKVAVPKNSRTVLYFSVLQSGHDLSWLCSLDDKALLRAVTDILKGN